MMKESEQKLFVEWKLAYKGRFACNGENVHFVEDGAVDEETFLTQRLRFVFILKESDGLTFPLTKYLLEGAEGNGGHTWNPVCRWLGDCGKAYSPEERAVMLKRIAAMNLKKLDDGNTSTNMRKLSSFVSDCDTSGLLCRQIELYSSHAPVIFVCCGSGMFDLVCEKVLGKSTREIDHTQAPVYMKLKDHAWIMAFRHPNCRESGLAERFQSYVTAITGIDHKDWFV